MTCRAAMLAAVDAIPSWVLPFGFRHGAGTLNKIAEIFLVGDKRQPITAVEMNLIVNVVRLPFIQVK